MTINETAQAISENALVKLIPAVVSVIGTGMVTVLWIFSSDFISTHITVPIAELHGEVSVITQHESIVDLKNVERDLLIKINQTAIDANKREVENAISRTETTVNSLTPIINDIKTSLAVLAEKANERHTGTERP